jgi:hypothetical protein
VGFKYELIQVVTFYQWYNASKKEGKKLFWAMWKQVKLDSIWNEIGLGFLFLFCKESKTKPKVVLKQILELKLPLLN